MHRILGGQRDGRTRVGALVLAAALGVLGCGALGCGAPAAEADVPDDAADQVADDGGGSAGTCFGPASAVVPRASVPSGYCAWTWAAGLSDPRGLQVAPNGDVLVVERGASRVDALFDDDGDGVSGTDERVVLAEAPGLNHGLAIHGGFLYASSDTSVYRWPYAPGARTALGTPQTVVHDLPAGGHATRTLVFDDAGRLYVSVGSASNVDPDASRAGIRRFALDALPASGWGYDAGEMYAGGMRNEVGLAFDGLGRLWGVENGIDNLARADLGGDIHQDNPGEELNRIDVGGRFYGYPYCWSEYLLPTGVGDGPGTQWADPGFIDDGVHDDAWCRDPAQVVRPALVLPAHTAPLGLAFYDGASFPAEVRGDAFVALHGSWDRDVPSGYKVVRVVFGGGDRPLRFEPFFGYAGPGDAAADWPHRPVDVRVGLRGELYVSSDASGVVLAIGYAGP